MENHSPDVHRETSDVNIGGIIIFVVVLIVSAVVIHGGVWALYRYFDAQSARRGPAEFPLATTAIRRLPPEPRLQTDPRDDLANLRRSENEVLQSYAWVDRGAGVVRIPIAQAMKLTAERGLPTR
jgi:hypothetical protein